MYSCRVFCRNVTFPAKVFNCSWVTLQNGSTAGRNDSVPLDHARATLCEPVSTPVREEVEKEKHLCSLQVTGGAVGTALHCSITWPAQRAMCFPCTQPRRASFQFVALGMEATTSRILSYTRPAELSAWTPPALHHAVGSLRQPAGPSLGSGAADLHTLSNQFLAEHKT